MSKIKTTKKAYEEFLNELSPEQGSIEWIIGGKIRMYYMWKNEYGTATRKFDPIKFQIGFKDWKRENEN